MKLLKQREGQHLKASLFIASINREKTNKNQGKKGTVTVSQSICINRRNQKQPRCSKILVSVINLKEAVSFIWTVQYFACFTVYKYNTKINYVINIINYFCFLLTLTKFIKFILKTLILKYWMIVRKYNDILTNKKWFAICNDNFIFRFYIVNKCLNI